MKKIQFVKFQFWFTPENPGVKFPVLSKAVITVSPIAGKLTCVTVICEKDITGIIIKI